MNQAPSSLREAVVEVLRLYVDPVAPTMYQQAVPAADVPAELFCIWCDDLYHPDTEGFRAAFGPPELQALAAVDSAIRRALDRVGDRPPPLGELLSTPEWRKVQQAASRAMSLLAHVGGLPERP